MGMVTRNSRDLTKRISCSYAKLHPTSHPTSYVEYCVQAWSYHLKKDTECLETVGKTATKITQGLCYLASEDRVVHLGLTILNKFWQRY